jgi:hypothetical protein
MKYILPLLLLTLVLLLWHVTSAPAPSSTKAIDTALARATAFLLKSQSPDGAFRSDTYGLLKDPLTLTPHVLYTLQELPPSPPVLAARQKAAAFLLATLTDDRPLSHPVYTLATTVSALARERTSPGKIQPLLDRLLAYQFTEASGWSIDDLPYGGWGYNLLPLRKSATPDPTLAPPDTNVSSTVYALRALSDAQLPSAHPAFAAARRFLAACQNLPPAGALPTSFDDGGFFFSSSETSRNKAAEAGTDPAGVLRYRSYGTMTADGLRALIHANIPPVAREPQAAATWLRTRFAVDVQPGDFPQDRALFRLGMYYYYLASLAQAAALHSAAAPPAWAQTLSAELLARQNADGSWVNAYTDAREDDPLVATFHAALALALARKNLAGP